MIDARVAQRRTNLHLVVYGTLVQQMLSGLQTIQIKVEFQCSTKT
jgi:hypothetical protein